jgi:hypothetical protein
LHIWVGCTLARRHTGVGTGIIAGKAQYASVGRRSRALLGWGAASAAGACHRCCHWSYYHMGYGERNPAAHSRGFDGTYGFGQHSSGRHIMELGSHFFRLGISDAPKADMLSLSRHPFQLAPSPAHYVLCRDGITLRNGATVIPSLVVSRTMLGGSHLSSWTCGSANIGSWCA